MDYYSSALALIKSGAPLVKLTALPVREEIMRIKSKYTNDEADKIQDVKMHLENQLDELRRLYRRTGSV